MKDSALWNVYARAYDVTNKNVPYVKMLDEVVQELQIHGEFNVLDAGCGTGNLLKKMSKVSFNSKFVGVDSSEEMLNRARKKFLSHPDVALQCFDLNTGLPFPDDSFDRVVSVNTLYALQQPDAMIAEFHRVLKPDGKLVFANPHNCARFSGIMKGQLREFGMLKFFMQFIMNLPALLVIIFVNMLFLRTNRNYWSREETERILKDNGFRDITIRLTYADQDFLVSASKT